MFTMLREGVIFASELCVPMRANFGFMNETTVVLLVGCFSSSFISAGLGMTRSRVGRKGLCGAGEMLAKSRGGPFPTC